MFIPPREPWRNGTIERFNDTFDQRFFRQERFTGVEHLTERAGAFERFHNAQHRYSATRGLAPDETPTASKPRTPIALDQLPAGWPKRGTVEFIRFIRSDHKLRILGRAIPMPDGSAYQYVTATLDLALTAREHNLLITSDQGELLTESPPAHPEQLTPADGAQRVNVASPRPPGSAPQRSRALTHSPGETMCWR